MAMATKSVHPCVHHSHGASFFKGFRWPGKGKGQIQLAYDFCCAPQFGGLQRCLTCSSCIRAVVLQYTPQHGQKLFPAAIRKDLPAWCDQGKDASPKPDQEYIRPWWKHRVSTSTSHTLPTDPLLLTLLEDLEYSLTVDFHSISSHV